MLMCVGHVWGTTGASKYNYYGQRLNSVLGRVLRLHVSVYRLSRKPTACRTGYGWGAIRGGRGAEHYTVIC